MNPERHERVGQLFLAARALPGSQRSVFLDEACAGDESLRREIESLLESDQAALNLADVPGLDVRGAPEAAQTPVSATTRDAPDDLPMQIGPYECISELGVGGFGVVYLAAQQQPIERRVALKVIKQGMDTREVLARFAAERQALAVLEHPGIAKVHDAGTTETGRPYFVMELVQGAPITSFCDEQQLGMRDRLTLFIAVCHAIQHAHQKGIIHRDIKPNNVMVTRETDRPVPKVIDFGIAKAIDVEATDPAALTRQHQLLGTPAYMSPEQAGIGGIDIDTRTDVYALGVLLYELLTGTTPFSSETLRAAGILELPRIIRDEIPPRPSTRLSRLDTSQTPSDGAHRPEDAGSSTSVEHIARLRRTDPAGLRRRLRGDLDRIVMKCLEKDRDRRYQTAKEIADDIHRHLVHEPVLARPTGSIERLVKFTRRNRTLVAGVGATALALIFGLIGTTRFALREARQRAETQIARDESEAVTRFLSKALAAVSPEEAGQDVPMRTVLDRAAERIEGQFADQPRVEARLRATIGNTYRALGLPQRADPHLRRALALRRTLLGATHADTLRTMCFIADSLIDQGDYPAGQQMAQEAMEKSAAHLGEDDTATVLATSILARAYDLQGRHDLSEPLHQRVLDTRRATLGGRHAETIKALNSLAGWYWDNGRYDEAADLYQEVLDARRATLGPEHGSTLRATNNLGTLYHKQGRFADAEKTYLECLDGYKRVFGEEHPDTLDLLSNLATLYVQSKKAEEAVNRLEEVLAIRRRVSGPHHPNTLITMNNLSVALGRAERVKDAEHINRELLEIRREVLGPEHPDTMTTLCNLGGVLVRQKLYAEAEPLHLEAVEVARRAFAPDHPIALLADKNLAELYFHTDRIAQATPLFERSHARHIERFGAGHFKTLVVTNGLAHCYLRQDRPADARALLSGAAEQAQESLPARHWLAAGLRVVQGRAFTKLQEYAAAEAVLVPAAEQLEQTLGPGHRRTRAAFAALVALYDAWGRPERATTYRNRIEPAAP